MDSAIKQIFNAVKAAIVEEWVLSGHRMTGAFEDSLKYEVKESPGLVKLQVMGRAYGAYLSRGVEAQNIPYTPGPRGRGGKSKYITGLKNWVQMKLGIGDEREALGIAFAIAHKHSEEGMPIRDGQLGSRFLMAVREKHRTKIRTEVKKYFDREIQNTIKHGNNRS
jgi:hypothetical protein